MDQQRMDEQPTAEPSTDARAALGARLRELRVAAGLSQRALTRQIGLSAHSNLADYESGRRVPPLDVLLACERVLTTSDGALVALRTSALAQAAARGRTATLPVAEPAPPPTVPASASRRRSRRTYLLGALAIAASVVAAFVVGQQLVSPDAGTPQSAPATLATAGLSADQAPGGADGVSACDDRTSILDSTEVAAGGRDVGTLSLRYSPGCSLGWARFIPAAGLSAADGGVVLAVHRPDDGATTTLRLTGVVGAESDPLLTSPGCVYAQATVSLGRGRTASATTACLVSG